MLTIKLSGRIDANNAADTEAMIAQRLAESSGEVPEFDASELEYISSAGLRVLLKFRKQFGKLDVLNVSSEVYDIFEVTGFTELLNVRKRLREISLDGCEVIGGGTFSTVYRLDPETIVKVFTHPMATLAGAEKDRMISREVFLHDIPTAISYDVVKVGDKYGLVYEMIDADTVSGTLRKHPERLEELSLKMARLLKKLHTTEFEQEKFPDVRSKLYMMVQGVYENGFITADEKAIADGVIDRIPYRKTFVHTDFHPKNVMVSCDDLMLIDVGDAGLGHPIIDFMFSYAHFVFLARDSAQHEKGIHEKIIGLNADTLGAMWNIILPEYFGTSDKERLSRYEGIMSDYASIFLMGVASISEGKMPVEIRKNLCRKAITHLCEAADTLKPIDGM